MERSYGNWKFTVRYLLSIVRASSHLFDLKSYNSPHLKMTQPLNFPLPKMSLEFRGPPPFAARRMLTMAAACVSFIAPIVCFCLFVRTTTHSSSAAPHHMAHANIKNNKQ
jgi:hypothetical protein